MLKYSIIIPFYNVEDYIVECAKSIHKQGFSDFEAIFVDDGSMDSSRKLLEKYLDKIKDPRLKIISKKNGGLSDARNYGLKKSKGMYIVFADSDDFIEKKFFERIDKIITKEKPDILYFDFYEYYDKNKFTKVKALKSFKSDDIIKNYLISAPAAWNKVYKKELFTKNNIYYPKGLWYEDLATTPRLLLVAKKISYLKVPLYYYRQRQGSIMNNFSEKVYNMYNVLEMIYETYLDNKLLDKYREEIERVFIYNVYFVVSKLGCSNTKSKIQKQIKAIEFLNKYFPKWNKNKYLKEEKVIAKLNIKVMKYKILLPIYNIIRRI